MQSITKRLANGLKKKLVKQHYGSTCTQRYLCMRSRGIWLTVLMRGVQLNSLTPSNGGTTAPISYTQCYKSGGGVTSGTMPYTGGAPPMLWTPPPLAYNSQVS